MLAMDSRTPRLTCKPASSFTTIASELAPTGVYACLRVKQLSRNKTWIDDHVIGKTFLIPHNLLIQRDIHKLARSVYCSSQTFLLPPSAAHRRRQKPRKR